VIIPPGSGTVQLVQGQVVQPWASGTFTGQDPDQEQDDPSVQTRLVGRRAVGCTRLRRRSSCLPDRLYPRTALRQRGIRRLSRARSRRGQAGAAGEPPIPNLCLQKVGIGRMNFSDQESRPQIHDSVPKHDASLRRRPLPRLSFNRCRGDACAGSCPVVVLGTADWRERGVEVG